MVAPVSSSTVEHRGAAPPAAPTGGTAAANTAVPPTPTGWTAVPTGALQVMAAWMRGNGRAGWAEAIDGWIGAS